MSQKTLAARLKKFALLPVYTLQLFSGAKSFRDNPVIGSKLLNRLGLHVVRVVLAAGMTKLRYLCLTHLMDKSERQSFSENGYLLIENFLPQEIFDSLNDEVRGMQEVEVRQCIQGDTLTQRVLLNEAALEAAPVCQQLVNNAEFLDRMKYTSARNNSPIFYVQNVKSNARDADADPQRLLHSDTFHATMKAWLFLDEVGDHNGPFTYVAGSHKLTWNRLKWEYKKSIEGSSQENTYGSRGSLRVADDELEAMGMPAPSLFKVPANTLVIADTHGFHRRGAASEKSDRLEIWAYSRTNPFNPLVGFNLDWYNKLSHSVIDKYLKRADRIAEEKGMRASWHLIDSTEMFGEKPAVKTDAANEDQNSEAEKSADTKSKDSEIEAA